MMHCIRRVMIVSVSAVLLVAASISATPTSVVAASLFSSNTGQFVTEIDPVTGSILNVFSTPGVVLTEMELGPNGNLFGYDGNQFLEFDPATFALVNNFAAGATTAMAFGPIPPIPIPAAFPLFLSALACLGLAGWRSRKAA